MNIIQRKLIYNEAEIYLLTWNDRPCFIVSELAKAFDGLSREDLSLFLRQNASVEKGTDYDVIQGEEARRLRRCLEECGVYKRFSKAMIVYFEGLRKYFEHRRIRQVADFSSYLAKNKVNIYENSIAIIGELPESEDATVIAPEVSTNTEVQALTDSTDGHMCSSELLKYLSFMEDFIDTINKLRISPEKSVPFMLDITKFLEDQGLQPDKLLAQLKKWME